MLYMSDERDEKRGRGGQALVHYMSAKIKFTCFTCQMREMKKGGGVVRHMFRAHQKIEIKHHKNIGKTTLIFT